MDGNQVSDGAVRQMLSNTVTDVPNGMRENPRGSLALNVTYMEFPVLSCRINHAQSCVNERNSRQNLKEQMTSSV
jgi:hypothetical protein